MRHIFYRKDLADTDKPEDGAVNFANQCFEFKVFSPCWSQVTPQGLKISLASLLWALLYLSIWRPQGKEFKYYLFYDEKHLIHYSTVLPKYYRFPFMDKSDIQIGPYWTAEKHRGLGLCPSVIRKIINDYRSQKKYAYILIPEANIASQKSAVKAGFEIYGYGVRTRGFFGKFLLQTA